MAITRRSMCFVSRSVFVMLIGGGGGGRAPVALWRAASERNHPHLHQALPACDSFENIYQTVRSICSSQASLLLDTPTTSSIIPPRLSPPQTAICSSHGQNTVSFIHLISTTHANHAMQTAASTHSPPRAVSSRSNTPSKLSSSAAPR